MANHGRAAVLGGVALLALGVFLVLRGAPPEEPGPHEGGLPDHATRPATGPPAEQEELPPPEPRPAVEPAPAPSGPPTSPAVRGRVLGADGLPLEGVTVESTEGIRAWTDADGRFVLSQPAGRTRLTAFHPGQVPGSVELGVPSEGIEIRMEAGYAVSGRVSFPDGSPVPGMRIQVKDGRDRTASDETGRYVLSGLDQGPVTVWSFDAGQERAAEAGDTDVDFVMEKHVVRIHIVDEEGNGVLEGRFSFNGEGGGSHMGGAGGLDSLTGVLTICPPTGMRLLYSIKSPGKAQKAGEFLVEGDPALHDITVVLSEPGVPGTLSLFVVDDGGKSPKAISVTIKDTGGGLLEGFYEEKVELDAEGRCRLENLQAGTYRLKVEGHGGPWDMTAFGIAAEKEVQVDSGKEVPVEFLLRSGGWLRVTVRDLHGTVVVPDTVRLRDEKGEFVGGGFWGESKEGEWSWPSETAGPVVHGSPLAPGRYTVEVVRPPENQEVLGTNTVIVAPKTIVDVEVRLTK